MASLKAISDSMAPYTLMLSPKKRMDRLKPRRGGDKISTLIARLAKERELRISRVSPEDIEAHQTRARRLVRVKFATTVLAQLVTDSVMASETNAWSSTTALYSALRALSRHDLELTRQLEPARKFFALGSRKPKPAAK
ncbi:MAG TPA: hypothetical protein VFF06_02685 [Polyangia bacterium]|nr:hypothetical protein [Polyangia bacterium]